MLTTSCIACLTETSTPLSRPLCNAPKIYALPEIHWRPLQRRRVLRCGCCCTLAIPINRFMQQATTRTETKWLGH